MNETVDLDMFQRISPMLIIAITLAVILLIEGAGEKKP